MKKKRYTAERIIGVLEHMEAGRKVGAGVSRLQKRVPVAGGVAGGR
jgi:hypothetical protein